MQNCWTPAQSCIHVTIGEKKDFSHFIDVEIQLPTAGWFSYQLVVLLQTFSCNEKKNKLCMTGKYFLI